MKETGSSTSSSSSSSSSSFQSLSVCAKGSGVSFLAFTTLEIRLFRQRRDPSRLPPSYPSPHSRAASRRANPIVRGLGRGLRRRGRRDLANDWRMRDSLPLSSAWHPLRRSRRRVKFNFSRRGNSGGGRGRTAARSGPPGEEATERGMPRKNGRPTIFGGNFSFFLSSLSYFFNPGKTRFRRNSAARILGILRKTEEPFSFLDVDLGLDFKGEKREEGKKSGEGTVNR